MTNYEKQFSTTSINIGGRSGGKSRLADGSYEVNIVPPGSKREGHNPEELFALGYSACFHSALEAAKKQDNVKNDSIVRHTVTLQVNPEDDLDLKLKVDIEVGIKDMDQAETKKLIERANKICPYSRAIENGHVDLSLNAVDYQE